MERNGRKYIVGTSLWKNNSFRIYIQIEQGAKAKENKIN